MRQLLKTKLVDMDLSVRALNCLKAAEVDTWRFSIVQQKFNEIPFSVKNL
jgi:DNA-directed RNA polymerase alpha subunit